MKTKTIALLGFLFLMRGGLAMSNQQGLRQVRTYMPYSVPIDPVKMVTVPDMNLSYALAGTLVEWDKHKEISPGIMSKWEFIGEKTIRFFIRNGLRWSDGTPVISKQVKSSFERALRKYPEDLRSLSNLLSEIQCPNDGAVDFVLKEPARYSGLLVKLTEPNFGVLRLTGSGDLNLSVTTGPFFISKQSETELTLTRNSHWFKSNTEMPETVIIRRPGTDFSPEKILLNDAWANLSETTSMINSSVMSQYETGSFHIWKRPIDKMGRFQLSQNLANRTGFELFRYLRKSLNRENLFHGLRGYEITDQAFPRGLQLHDAKFKCDDSDASLPDEFKKRPVHILLSPARIGAELRSNIELEVERVTGIKPVVTSIALQDVGKFRKAGDYDFYVGVIGIADPDPEGIMSYYFEGDLPTVPKSSEKFVQRLDQARKELNPIKRIEMMTAIMTDATCKGHILPLFHLSTVGIGRPELDFSGVPLTDESITLSKIRFFKEGLK
jgi:MarR-like DNA-binding transcriptional regulator SgrR of sgrS sRNA